MKLEVKFANDSGAEVHATFDTENGAVASKDGRTGTFTSAQGSREVVLSGDENVTLTFADDLKMEAGFSTRYASSDGRAGVATIVSVS